jgi:hypothetical protein
MNEFRKALTCVYNTALAVKIVQPRQQELHRKFEHVGIVPAVDQSLLQYPNRLPHRFVDKANVCTVGAINSERINHRSNKFSARVRWVSGCDVLRDSQFMFCQSPVDAIVAADLECNEPIRLPVPPRIKLASR